MKEYCSSCHKKFHWWNTRYYCEKCKMKYCNSCKKEIKYSTSDDSSRYSLCNQCYNDIDSNVNIYERIDDDTIIKFESLGIISSKAIYTYQDALIDLKFTAMKKGGIAVFNVGYLTEEENTAGYSNNVNTGWKSMPSIPINIPGQIITKYILKGEAFKKRVTKQQITSVEQINDGKKHWSFITFIKHIFPFLFPKQNRSTEKIKSKNEI